MSDLEKAVFWSNNENTWMGGTMTTGHPGTAFDWKKAMKVMDQARLLERKALCDRDWYTWIHGQTKEDQKKIWDALRLSQTGVQVCSNEEDLRFWAGQYIQAGFPVLMMSGKGEFVYLGSQLNKIISRAEWPGKNLNHEAHEGSEGENG